MKKYMIRCDIEGVSGVVSYCQAEPGQSEFCKGQQWFMSDLMAVVNGLKDGGADEIHIYDEHYYGRNIDLERLPANVVTYCGKPPYRKDWAGGLDADFDGLILLGFHSKRGTENALLNHSYEPDIKDIRINGVSVGEIGVEAAIAGEYHVPLAMICADSEGVREAHELVGDTVAVTVKESLGEYEAICYPLEKTYAMIYEAAKKLVKDPSAAVPYRLKGRAVLEIDFFDTPYAKLYKELFGKAVFESDSITECWANYWQNKLKVGALLS